MHEILSVDWERDFLHLVLSSDFISAFWYKLYLEIFRKIEIKETICIKQELNLPICA